MLGGGGGIIEFKDKKVSLSQAVGSLKWEINEFRHDLWPLERHWQGPERRFNEQNFRNADHDSTEGPTCHSALCKDAQGPRLSLGLGWAGAVIWDYLPSPLLWSSSLCPLFHVLGFHFRFHLKRNLYLNSKMKTWNDLLCREVVSHSRSPTWKVGGQGLFPRNLGSQSWALLVMGWRDWKGWRWSRVLGDPESWTAELWAWKEGPEYERQVPRINVSGKLSGPRGSSVSSSHQQVPVRNTNWPLPKSGNPQTEGGGHFRAPAWRSVTSTDPKEATLTMQERFHEEGSSLGLTAQENEGSDRAGTRDLHLGFC